MGLFLASGITAADCSDPAFCAVTLDPAQFDSLAAQLTDSYAYMTTVFGLGFALIVFLLAVLTVSNFRR